MEKKFVCTIELYIVFYVLYGYHWSAQQFNQSINHKISLVAKKWQRLSQGHLRCRSTEKIRA